MPEKPEDLVAPGPIKLAEVLETLVNRAYSRAKFWGGTAIILQVVLYVAGIVALVFPEVTLTYPWVALPLALVTADIAGRASKYKGMAETAKRHHELLLSFGEQPSKNQLADLSQVFSKAIPKQTHELLKSGITYASTAALGPKRALENLSESAWFTKHLAGRCETIVRLVFIITLLIAVSLLLWAASTVSGTTSGMAIAKGVAATLIFLVSVGSIRGWIAYQSLHKKAGEIDAEACRLKEQEEPDPFRVHRLLSEYQLSRASAPMIPTWVWKLHRNSLNEHYKIKVAAE